MFKKYILLKCIVFLLNDSLFAFIAPTLRDTTPILGFDIEIGVAISKIQDFRSTIKPLSEFMEVKTNVQNSGITSGLYCSFGGVYKFSKRFSIEAKMSYYVNGSNHRYTVNHSIEHLIWSEQSWLVSLNESFFQMPIVGVLTLGEKNILSFGLGGYLKYEQSTIIYPARSGLGEYVENDFFRSRQKTQAMP